MGVDIGAVHELDELVIGSGNFDATSLYVPSESALLFLDRAPQQGLAATTKALITFGFFFFDFDLDGWLDLFQTNGGLDLEGHKLSPPAPYLQPNQLFHNVPAAKGRRFALLEDDVVGDLATPCVGRGAAYADIDADGDLDILIAQIGRPPILLRNEYAGDHHWLRVKLQDEGPNPDAIGAWLTCVAGGRTQRAQVMPTRSYCSSVELPVTFGLGRAERIDELRVRWPDGSEQVVENPGIDRSITVSRTR